MQMQSYRSKQSTSVFVGIPPFPSSVVVASSAPVTGNRHRHKKFSSSEQYMLACAL